MKWLELAEPDFEEARRRSEGVVLVPVGSIEKHGPHLPVGCDTLIIERLVEMVAEREPVVVAPVLTYTYAPWARLHRGGISLSPEVLVEHLLQICDELARNGFGKIVVAHAHGGNVPFHEMALATATDRAKPYSLYSIPPLAGTRQTIDEVKETQEQGHACETETSLALYVFPHLCHMERVQGVTYPRQRDLDVGPASTPADWPTSYPDYAVGDASKASAEKGERIMEAWADTVASVVHKVKADKVVGRTMQRLREAVAPPGDGGA